MESTDNKVSAVTALQRKHRFETARHIAASVILGLLDAAGTYLVFTTVLRGTDSWGATIISFGIPLLIAAVAFGAGWLYRRVASRDGAIKGLIPVLLFMIVGFVVMFIAVSRLRAVTPIVDTSAVSTLLGSTSSSAPSSALSWVLIAMVLLIAAVEFALGFFFADPLKTERYQVELKMEEAKAAYLHDKAVEAELTYEGLSPVNLCKADQDAYDAACEQVRARARAYKARVRSTIAAQSGNPRIASEALLPPVTKPIAGLIEGGH